MNIEQSTAMSKLVQIATTVGPKSDDTLVSVVHNAYTKNFEISHQKTKVNSTSKGLILRNVAFYTDCNYACGGASCGASAKGNLEGASEAEALAAFHEEPLMPLRYNNQIDDGKSPFYYTTKEGKDNYVQEANKVVFLDSRAYIPVR